MLRFCFLLFVFVGQLHVAYSQSMLADSIRKSLISKMPGRSYVESVLLLSEQSMNPDTLLPFIQRAETMAVKSGDPELVRFTESARVNYYVRKSNHDSALFFLDPLLKYYAKDKSGQSVYLSLLFLKSKVYDRAAEFTQALAIMIEVIGLAEDLKDTVTMIQARTGIGWVQMEMGQFQESLQWLYKAKATSENQRFYRNYGALYSNLAMVHSKLGHVDSALYYIEVAIKDARANNNLVFLANALSMQARIFIDNQLAPKAETPLHEALLIRKKINDPFYIVYDMSSLAGYYAANHQPVKGIQLAKEGVRIAKTSGLTSQLLMIYQSLAENYKAAGLTEDYGETLEKILQLKDSFNSINSSKMLADLQANREAIKKEKLISEQKLNLTVKNYWLAGIVLFSLMVAVIGILLFRSYTRRKAIEMDAALAEEKRQAELAVRNAEEKERVRIAADLHDNLGAYAASMASNLNYIRIHQDDPITTSAFNELKSNSVAVISQLNDTIWVLRKESLSLTALSDRIKLFVSRISRSYPETRLEVNEQIEKDHQLSAAQAFHLYRVIQEGINNALKHSGASAITITIAGSSHWKLSIADNGRGFDPEQTAHSTGHGLKTMQERSAESGWRISWKINPGGGTLVELLPTTN